MLYCKKRRRRAYFLCHIPKGNDVIACKSMSLIAKTRRHNIFDLAGSSRTAGVQRQQFDHRETRGRNNQIFHAVHQRMTAISAVDCEITATSVPWYVVSQEVMTTKVDCDKGCKIAPRNNQQKIHPIASTRATIRHPIARRTMMSTFFMSYCDEQTTTSTLF